MRLLLEIAVAWPIVAPIVGVIIGRSVRLADRLAVITPPEPTDEGPSHAQVPSTDHRDRHVHPRVP